MPPSPSRPRNSPSTQFRKFSERSGRRGETLAALYLNLKGYRILARRVKTPVGEIDLIAHRRGITAFVEVKARSFSHQEAEALQAVNHRRIIRAAQLWLSHRPELMNDELRVDVIFLAPFAWPRHIVNAFTTTGNP